ncbi:MAG TPA: ATP-binding cassette domain-containing protein [Candidatus Binatia bacterium]|nr:ATP-binding cassette domain-containing protein [Candidatus Binatia bacterium]
MPGGITAVLEASAGLSRAGIAERAQTVELAAAVVTKTFNGSVKVLDGVSFQVHQGESVALIGGNGAGKSTLLRCCIGLTEIDRGTVRLFGEDIGALCGRRLRALRARVGFVFQQHNLVGRLSVLSNVLQGALGRLGVRAWAHSLAPAFEREKALHCLDLVGMADFAERRADRLSGGQSQRVAVARALMQEPRLVIADEAVASLDPKGAEEVMALFSGLMERYRITFLFSSHNLQHALQYASRLLALRKGSMILDAPTAAHSVATLRAIYD